jgi:hypothetical protein
MRTLFATIALLLATGLRGAQAQADAALAQADAVPSPLLLTTMPPPAHARMVTALDLGYNERAFEPVAGERLEPQASVLLPLSSAVAVLAPAMNTAAPWWPRRGSSLPAPRSDPPWPRAFCWSIPMPPAGMRWI